MKNLATISKDRYSKQVLEALEDNLSTANLDPLLQRLKDKNLSLREFGFVSKVRLNAATNFIPFLSATEEKTRLIGGWDEMALALRKNLNEELGLEDETYKPESDHDVWRNRYRSGLDRVLGAQGHPLQSIDDEDTTYNVGVFYGERLKVMPQEMSVPALAGAFTVLEGLLEKEFSAMLTYIQSRISDLTKIERTYIEHHAGHEHKHVYDAAVPLLRKCMTSPHIVPDVISGIQEMEKLRLQEVLGRIEMNLWKAEPQT